MPLHVLSERHGSKRGLRSPLAATESGHWAARVVPRRPAQQLKESCRAAPRDHPGVNCFNSPSPRSRGHGAIWEGQVGPHFGRDGRPVGVLRAPRSPYPEPIPFHGLPVVDRTVRSNMRPPPGTIIVENTPPRMDHIGQRERRLDGVAEGIRSLGDRGVIGHLARASD